MPTLTIIVTVPEPSNTCFIALPFADEFKALASLITEAGNRLALQSIRTDQIQMGISFVQDIIDQTRSARIVVAVCSPEAESKKPNPNVMYELGLAQALGKPTIIMTNDISSLPADVDKNYALPYNSREVDEKEGLILKIKDAMGNRFGRMKDPLTDSAWHKQGISVNRDEKRLHENPGFLEKFQTIHEYAKGTYELFQNVYEGYVSQLVQQSKENAANPNLSFNEKTKLEDIWTTYNKFYMLSLTKGLTQQNTTPEKIDELLHYLLANADSKSRGKLLVCIEFNNFIKKGLYNFHNLHLKLIEDYRGSFVHLNAETATQVYSQFKEFSDTTKEIPGFTFLLDSNLMDLIVSQ